MKETYVIPESLINTAPSPSLHHTPHPACSAAARRHLLGKLQGYFTPAKPLTLSCHQSPWWLGHLANHLGTLHFEVGCPSVVLRDSSQQSGNNLMALNSENWV